MNRFGLLIVLVFFPWVLCAAEPDSLSTQLAMSSARDFLHRNQPGEALRVLEAELPHTNGNPAFLELLRNALSDQLKQLQISKAPADRIDAVRSKLKMLTNGPTSLPDRVVSAPPSPPPPEPVPPVVEQEKTDPFQQVPLDRQPKRPVAEVPVAPSVPTRSGGEAAMEAFRQKKYPEAARLFATAGDALSADEKLAWGYCRLHAVSLRLNESKTASLPAGLEQEARTAMELGGDKLSGWGQKVIEEIVRRSPKKAEASATVTTAIPTGWKVIDSANFRVIYRTAKNEAQEVSTIAEMARTAMFERWASGASGVWSPKCDLWLHDSAEGFPRASGGGDLPGHARVALRDGKVLSRRIDLKSGDAELLDVTLPHEVTFLIVSELFADQPLPRWAEVAITGLAESPTQVQRYLRVIPKSIAEKGLFPVGQLLKMTEFPEAGRITVFYAESISLVDYLVKQKGPQAFALFLREAPRRGYEECLKRHYGFRDADDLQEKWLASVAVRK